MFGKAQDFASVDYGFRSPPVGPPTPSAYGTHLKSIFYPVVVMRGLAATLPSILLASSGRHTQLYKSLRLAVPRTSRLGGVCV